MRPLRLLAAVAGAPRLLGARPTAPSYSLSGASGTAPAPDRPSTRARLRAWAELLRVSALFTVPGDALAGAAAVGRRPGRGTALAVGASLCLYEAGMALNDWADREEDAVDRPHRPIPSGRVAPGAALAAAGVLTAAGLALAGRAGRPALAVASGLAATVWAYDLRLKHTRLGPATMASARTLDLLLGATATARPGASTRPGATARRGASAAVATMSGGAAGGGATVPAPGRTPAAALPAALLLGAHTYAVTAVSRHEAQGGSTAAPLAALAGVAGLGAAVLRGRATPGGPPPSHPAAAGRLLLPAFAAAYLRTSAVPLLHAALNPSPPLTQRAVGGGIRAMIPLQAALAARAGAPVGGLAVMGLVPLARALSRKVSPT
ncbi:SCO3242 family prenyltransferase [Streptomyces sp. NPDC102451]|uniref:SCO3242 family prenyltransferase n=1 Tax=Streptomyces sp. NPDC102451 TaxID=3366177 RepID=UPI003810A4E3